MFMFVHHNIKQLLNKVESTMKNIGRAEKILN